MFYQDIFNTQYINQQYYQMLQDQKFYFEQQKEFANMIKALNDFIDSANKIVPQYQEEAMNACVATVCGKMYGKNN